MKCVALNKRTVIITLETSFELDPPFSVIADGQGKTFCRCNVGAEGPRSSCLDSCGFCYPG